jgi:cation transport regulator ChaC
MWVFGYGSLMWDGWEVEFGAARRERATLPGVRRDFNKASWKNWGTRAVPAPTLGLVPEGGASCVGFAFEFADANRDRVLATLRDREGKSFRLDEKPITLDSGEIVNAIVPVNDPSSATFIGNQSIETRARLARAAVGSKGNGVSYVRNIHEKLRAAGIDDRNVEEFWQQVEAAGNVPGALLSQGSADVPDARTIRGSMPALRSEIEKALDEIISNEEGMSFQGLAVVLARQRWPELIASERKNDLGLDAYASASLSPDKIGKGLACSITGELSKIADDAKKVKQHFTDVNVLLFYTPEKVSNPKKKEWAERIQKDFGYELQVMSREEIITSLMEPGNASLCSSMLAIDVETDAATSEVIERIVAAAAAEAATWAIRTPGPLISLMAARIDEAGNDSSDLYRLGSIMDALDEGRRLVLEGPAGRGKTTTLSQLAQMQARLSDVSFLVDLPAWISSGRPILEFISQSPQFQARGLDALTLAKVKDSVQFSFLLNGWNEIELSDSVRAGEALRTLDRSFISAGIIVATRTHHIRPPLPGAQRLRLLQLTRRQRNDYLRQRLADRARDLARQLDADATLDELTRTPLVLSAVASIFSAGNPIPTTKMGVLDAVARLLEDAPEHTVHLASPPLNGFHHQYLGALATQMTSRGAVNVPDADARAIVHTAAQRLHEAHQITTLPAPADVLAALSAHDILERLEYPAIAFRFTHQQFQELHAAVDIKRQLLLVAARNQADERRDFTATYVNMPAWTEPLRMIAETIGLQRDESTADRSEVQAGRALVEMALGVDPVFAAELARLCGSLVWREVGPTLSARLRSWHGVSDEHHRNCALAAMIATGSEEFRDILVPFLSGDGGQLSLRTYRLQADLHLTSLGPKWRETVSSWNESARVSFVSELLRDRFVPEMVDFALSDNCAAVQKAALDGLIWNGLEDEAAQFMEAIKPQTFDAIAREEPPDLIPTPVRARALEAFQKLPDDADAASHLTTLLKRAELGEANSNQLKETLDRLHDKITEHWMQQAIRRALDILRAGDAEWVSHWVAGRIASGSLWSEHWKPFVSTVPTELVDGSLRKLETEDLKNAHFGGLITVIAAGADAKLASRVFSNLRGLRQTITAAPEQRHDFEWQSERQLETLFRDLPLDVAVEGLLSVVSLDPGDVEVVSRLFTRVARHDAESIANVDGGLKKSLHTYVKKGLAIVLQQDDYNGELKANYASVIAQLGEPEDINDLMTLVRSDIERVKRGHVARAAGDRGPMSNGSAMSWASWHIRAIAELDSPGTDDVLINLLGEVEYERWVAEELPKLVLPTTAGQPFAKTDYGAIWAARDRGYGPDPHRDRRQRFAAALREHTARRLDEYQRDPKPALVYLLKELAKALAALDPRGSAEIALQVMSLPGSGDGWQQAAALESILFGGAALPTDPIIAMVDAAVAHAQRYGPQDNERWLVNRFLCILPFADAPARGIQKIREVIALPWVYAYELRGVAAALGHSRSDEALALLRELACDPARARQLEDDWINGVAALNTPAAKNLLMSFVDPDVEGLPEAVRFDRLDVLAGRIADFARQNAAIEARLRELCAREMVAPKRLLLTKVMNFLGTPEALLAALSLIDDRAQPPYEYDTWEQLENAFVEKKPYGERQGTYTLAARAANEVRLRLFGMLDDPRRKRSAFSLLGQIEEWRLEHGRPLGEPRHPAFGSGGRWPPQEPA